MTSGHATMTRPEPRARLSPKVRRLLRDHQLDPSQVDGSGTRGRITPADVRRTAGGASPAPRPDRRRGPTLVSPLARRLLREAGLALQDVQWSGPITRAVAEQAIARDRADDEGGDGPAGSITMDVDLTRVLYGVGGAREPVRQRTGVEVTPLAVLAHAACRSLRRHPAFHGAHPDGGTEHRDVDLAVVLDAGGTSVAPVVACAQDLTVTGLAARIARSRADDVTAGTPDATFTIVGDGWGPTPSVRPGRLPTTTGVLTVEAATQRQTTGTDEFGGETTSTRWVTTLRLAVPDTVDEADAVGFLDDLKRELETVDLLAAVA